MPLTLHRVKGYISVNPSATSTPSALGVPSRLCHLLPLFIGYKQLRPHTVPRLFAWTTENKYARARTERQPKNR